MKEGSILFLVEISVKKDKKANVAISNIIDSPRGWLGVKAVK